MNEVALELPHISRTILFIYSYNGRQTVAEIMHALIPALLGGKWPIVKKFGSRQPLLLERAETR